MSATPPTVLYHSHWSYTDVLTIVRRFAYPGVSLTPCCFVVYSTRQFGVCLSLCHFLLVFFSPFSIAITSFGEERANLSAFRTFGLCLFRFVGFLFLLGSGKGCGLWLWYSLDFSLTFYAYVFYRILKLLLFLLFTFSIFNIDFFHASILWKCI